MDEKILYVERTANKVLLKYPSGNVSEYEIVDGMIPADIFRLFQIGTVADGYTVKIKGFV